MMMMAVRLVLQSKWIAQHSVHCTAVLGDAKLYTNQVLNLARFHESKMICLETGKVARNHL